MMLRALSVSLLTPWLLTGTRLELTLDYQRAALTGTATLRLRNVGTAPVSSVPLLLNRLMTVTTASTAFEQHIAVFEDDSLLQVNAATLQLQRPVAPGDSVSILVAWSGRLVGYTETGSLYIRDHIERDFTILREDAFAFPSLGVPSRAANRAMRREPFGFALAVTVPAGLVVATGGHQAGTRAQDSTVTWSYRSESPVPFLNIAIAPYRTVEQPGLRLFSFPQDSGGAVMVQQAVRDAMARLGRWFGPLRTRQDVTIIEIPEGYGSQASLTGGIIETADAFRDRRQLYQLYHELSHLWNPPDLDRPSPRWNEGLATWLQWRLAAELDGWSKWDAWLSWTESMLKSDCASSTHCATIPFLEYGRHEATDLSYAVGGAMFWLLYEVMGAKAFDGAYAGFLQRHGAEGGNTGDLVRAFQAAAPEAQAILSDWLSTTRWYTRLSGGESLRQMLTEYRRH